MHENSSDLSEGRQQSEQSHGVRAMREAEPPTDGRQNESAPPISNVRSMETVLPCIVSPDRGAPIEPAYQRLQRSVEAVLFVASEPLSVEALARCAGGTPDEIRAALTRIELAYAERGIVLRRIAGGFRFASAPTVREAVEAYLNPPTTHLSQAALETLAIVAYSQPVTRAQVEAIRGVSVHRVFATLLERGLIEETGRDERTGRPIRYRTTPAFLQVFGLNSLDELPTVSIEATPAPKSDDPSSSVSPLDPAA
jgi:segregation and condensation protein B